MKRKRSKDSKLHIACSEGHITTFRDLLNNGLDVDSKAASRHPGFCRTALHIACRHGHSEVVRELLNRGADMEVVDDFRSTPLHEACTTGHLEVMSELLDRHANMEAVDKYHETPLHVACTFGHLEVIQELLDRGADIEAVAGVHDDTPLFTAVLNSSVLVARLLLSRGASVNAVDSDGGTALHRACLISNLDAVNELLDYGADVDASRNGWTPLNEASIHGEHEFVRTLLVRGAAMDIADNHGNTPLHNARNTEIVNLLLDAGADIDSRTNAGETALEDACRYKDSSVVKLLLSRGASYSDMNDLIAIVDRREHWMPGKRDLMRFLEEFAPDGYVMK